MPDDPFRALGLPAEAGLTDDDVRAAWHRAAAATHPDRADGGDPAAFSAAAAAYSNLRTPFGRGEALADLNRPPRTGWRSGRIQLHRQLRRQGRRRRPGPTARRGRASRLRNGLPPRLGLLVLGGAATGAGAVIADGWHPASIAVIAGAATWVARGGHRYLSARPAAGNGPPPPSQRDSADEERSG
ncbi:MAG: hypothetical protein ACRDNZ_07840 [Streptosporangiaceae bacterium]